MFINKTAFDENTIVAFRRVYYKWVKKMSGAIFFIVITLGIFMYFYDFKVLSYILFFLGIIIPVFLLFLLPSLIIKKANKNPQATQAYKTNLIQTYFFKENQIEVVSNKALENQTPLIILYNNIKQVVKVKGYVIFYTTNNLGFALDETKMVKGTIDDIYILLKKVVKNNKKATL